MRHVRKTAKKSLMPKILLIVVLVAALSISSVVTVMANTADITVYDGSETYRFSMIGQNPQDILSRAQTEGMAPVSDIDTYDFSPENGTLTVQRFVRVSVKEDNASQMILAPKGKTLSDVFAENEITLGAKRYGRCRSHRRAYGRHRRADHPCKACVCFGRRRAPHGRPQRGHRRRRAESRRHHARRKRHRHTGYGYRAYKRRGASACSVTFDLTVTADGKTIEKSAAAENYSDAVEAMGITLGENDRILVATAEGEKQVKAEDNVSSGDVIRVVRIRTEEITENEVVVVQHGIRRYRRAL